MSVQKMALSDYVEQVLTTSQDLRMFLYNIKSHILSYSTTLPSDLADGFQSIYFRRFWLQRLCYANAFRYRHVFFIRLCMVKNRNAFLLRAEYQYS